MVAQRERDAAVRLLRELLLEQVRGPGRPGAREGEVVVPLLAERRAHRWSPTAATIHTAITPKRMRTLARPTR